MHAKAAPEPFFFVSFFFVELFAHTRCCCCLSITVTLLLDRSHSFIDLAGLSVSLVYRLSVSLVYRSRRSFFIVLCLLQQHTMATKGLLSLSLVSADYSLPIPKNWEKATKNDLPRYYY